MVRIPQIRLAALAITACFASGAWAASADQAGKAIFVAPPVSVEHGASRALKQGDPVRTGDTVVTGDKARAQLLMGDGARIALRSNSRFRIDDFALPATVSAPTAATAVAADGRSFTSLLKGGLRTTSGAIGKHDPAAYEMRTPVGTLGIRGTDYAMVICRGNDCADVAGAPNTIRDGLYISVFAGSIAFKYGAEEIVLNANQHLFIPLAGGRPEPLQDAPAWVLGDGAGQLVAGKGARAQPQGTNKLTDFNNRRSPDAAKPGAEGNNGQTKGTADGSSDKIDQPITGTNGQGLPVDLTPGGQLQPRNINLAFSIPAVAQFTAIQGTTANNQTQFSLQGGNELIGMTIQLPLAQAPVDVSLTLGSTASVNKGGDDATGLRWGRWTGGAMTVNAGGQPTTQDLAQQSLHWIYADAATTPAMPQTGTATYTLIGGTNPTDNQGNVGTLGAAAFAADFTNQTVTSSLDLTINGTNWTATGTGTIGAQLGLAPHQFGGTYGTVVIGASGATGFGNFSGFFTSTGGTQVGIPGGAGLSYALTDGQGLVLDGTVAFHGP